MSVLHLDFETFSGTELPDAGAHLHVADPDFTVTVIAWAFDDGPVHSRVWPDTDFLPGDIWAHVGVGGAVHAWNTAFEHAVLHHHYRVPTSFEQFVCTMQRALVYGLPGGLDKAGPAAGAQVLKDTSMKGLVTTMSKPRKPSARKPGLVLEPWHKADPAKLQRLQAYCEQDVRAEREMGRRVPHLSPFEKKVSLLDAKSNWGGVVVDRQAVLKLMGGRNMAVAALARECETLTQGAVTSPAGQGAKILAWLNRDKVFGFSDLKKATVAQALADPQTAPLDRRVLEIRQASAKSSLAKLETMLACTGADERARGLLQYAGAGRTLRWAGRLIQPQNLPRNANPVEDVDALLGDIRGKTLTQLSKCLRGCLIAGPGLQLVMLDLSQIEARVLAWLAGQQDVLDVFASGADVYTHAAAKQGSTERQLGKVLVLAAGFGMGHVKFRQTAADDYKLVLTELQAMEAVRDWRAHNPRIVSLWHDTGSAVARAIAQPGTIFHIGRHMAAVVQGGVLRMRKPNGDCLIYHRPRLEGTDIVFDGVHPKTKQWGEVRTWGGTLAQNVTQATARDVLAAALLRIEKELGMMPIMSVHDEAVYEVPLGWVNGAIQRTFDRVPPWAPGLPVASKQAVGVRYGK